MNGLRLEYQSQVNFVILDFDDRDQRSLAGEMGVARHPAFATVPPNSGPDTAGNRAFGPLSESDLREVLDRLVAAHQP